MEVENEKPYKIIDLFAGAGGLSNGFEQTGRFEVVGAIEINKAAQETFIANHNDNKNIIIKDENGKSDITKINFNKVLLERQLSHENLVVIGGPPCQGFSNANRQKNYLISGNNQLVKEFVRAIVEIKPVAFLMENVKTIDSEKHKFFIAKDNSLGSKEHLKQIAYSKEDKFWKDDVIQILQTENVTLKETIQNVINNGSSNPIITNDSWLARMRSLDRKLRKTDSIKLEKKEEREVNQIITYLNQIISPTNDEYLWLHDIGALDLIKDALVALSQLIHAEEINSKYVYGKFRPLIDINTLLLRMCEINVEEINIIGKLNVFVKNSELFVEAKVESYNVIEYLERVFISYGYVVDPKVLTASEFGVPQKRNRFFMLGVQKEKIKNTEVKLPLKNDHLEKYFTTRDAIVDLEKIPPHHEEGKTVKYFTNPQTLTPLQKYYRSGIKGDNLYNHINTKSKALSKKRFEAIKATGGKNFHSLSDELKKSYADFSRTQNTVYLRLNYDEPSPTVINVRKSMWNHPSNAVALSIREAARLQSFRDDFIFKGSKDQQYQQVGNAVPPILARSIAEGLLKILGLTPILSITEELKLDKSLIYS